MHVPAARIVFSDADRAEIASRVGESLRTGALTLGPNTREFEQLEMCYTTILSDGRTAVELIPGGRYEKVPFAASMRYARQSVEPRGLTHQHLTCQISACCVSWGESGHRTDAGAQ